jgi:hypothetical protein
MDFSLKNKIIDNFEKRWIDIYKITNVKNNKCYIGQSVSHILNHKRYRPYGMMGRFKSHISEAYSNKTKQCCYLNNAIKKYGKESFELSLLDSIESNKGDIREIELIKEHNTLFPNGYNLCTGGKSTQLTLGSKIKISKSVSKLYDNQKLKRFENVKISKDIDMKSVIKPLNRGGIQYGWYVYINRIKADFGGVHISLTESKETAIKFVQKIINKCETSYNDGKPLRASDTIPIRKLIRKNTVNNRSQW